MSARPKDAPMPAAKQESKRGRKKYPTGAIVPSKCRYRKSKKSENEEVGIGGPLPQKPGFVMQDAGGNEFLLNDYPTSGGPWGPAWSNTANNGAGGFVWVNHGG